MRQLSSLLNGKLWSLFLGGFLCLTLIPGCGPGKQRLDVDVSAIGVADVVIHRYDLDLFRLNPGQLQQGLESMKPAYRFFLDTDLGDPARLSEMRAYLENPRNIAFHAAVDSQFRETGKLEKDLTMAFRHYLYYFPGFKVPRVYAYISGGDYDFPVQFADSVMLIGLDNYLGKAFRPYVSDGLAAYRIDRMTLENIVPDCMRVLGKITYPAQVPGNTLLEQMVDAGKRLLFLEAMVPEAGGAVIMGYSKAQFDWVKANEAHVWAAIIENRILYTTDGKLIRTFMADGPFTAEFSKEAPARLGEWLGWQIVRKYFENNPGVTLPQLMNEPDAQKILSQSGFKPEK
jgi:uncharacterized protein YjaZ